MSKYIDLEDCVDVLQGFTETTPTGKTAQDLVKALPTIDIVHCNECKHNENTCINHGEMRPRCRYTNYTKSADDFCSYGERRGNTMTNDTKSTRYTVTAWLFDKRCNDNCNLKSCNTDSLEGAIKWIGKIKKAWGDSVVLIDRENDTVKHIELKDNQRVE